MMQSNLDNTVSKKQRTENTAHRQIFFADIAVGIFILLAVICLKFPIFKPNLYISNNSIYFGKVKNGAFVNAKYKIVNLHPWPITVTGLQGGCGCINAFPGRSLPFSIRPFESFSVQLGFDTMKTGELTRTAYVTTSENEQSVGITLHGFVE
jgi:hypothetical protein